MASDLPSHAAAQGVASGAQGVAPDAQGIALGVDTSKASLDLADSSGALLASYPNDAHGIARLIDDARRAGPRVVVVESAGGVERDLLDALLDAGLPAALVNPRNVRHFAKGIGVEAKNDRLDSKVLALYGLLVAPRLLQKRSAAQAELDELVSCRRHLVASRVAHSNRLGSARTRAARKGLERMVRAADEQVAAVDARIREIVSDDDDLSDLDRLLRGVPGVGPGTSAALIAELPELGGTDRRKVAALVGVAPFDDESGSRRGRRSIRGGRKGLRGTLYMAAVSAMRCNPVIRRLDTRLKAAGKAFKVRVVAAMHKLLTLLNVIARDRIPWDRLDVVKTA